MGAINYHTSDYITLSIKPYNTTDYINDCDFMDFIKENWNIDINNETELLNAVNEQINIDYECDRENVENILDKYYFYYFHVVIKPGYYEGFSLDIENNFGLFYNSYEDKKEAQKEITQLKKCLLELAGVGMVETFPHWCTGYKDYKETIQGIKNAIKEMREECKHIPTYNTYNEV
jgi:hypothetical protein